MDETRHPNNFPTLTNEQICGLATAVCDDFGGDLSREAFTEKLLLPSKTFQDSRRARWMRGSSNRHGRRTAVAQPIPKILLAHQLSDLSKERFSVRASIFREVEPSMAVRANGDRVRWRIRSAVRKSAEMMDLQKWEAICADKRSRLVASLACPICPLQRPCFDLRITYDTGRG